MTRAEFNKKQLDSMNALIHGPEPKTQIEKDIFNLKYIRYSIGYASCWYRWGIIATLDRVIKNLEVIKDE